MAQLDVGFISCVASGVVGGLKRQLKSRLEDDEMGVLRRMRRVIREQRYRISSHANDEMADDFLEAADVENVILTGEIVQKFTHDPRGTRYEVLGDTTDYRRAYVVCRFLLSGTLLVITTYVEETER